MQDSPSAEQLELPLDPLGERWVKTPQQHARLMHEGGKGVVYVCRGGRGGAWRQKPYPVEVALEVARYYRDQQNVFLSTQRFSGSRSVAELLCLSSLWADVDFYGVERYELWHPYMVYEEALRLLVQQGIPEPTVAIATGRGLCLLWLHDPIRRAALTRWQACQRHIWQTLKPLGADRFAQDAARVLRLVGTRNRRPGTAARPVEALTPVGKTYAFDHLAGAILPISRAEVESIRIRRALKDARKPPERRTRPPEGFDQGTLCEARLSDLQRLRESRWFGPLPPRHRDQWMLIAGSAASYLVQPVCPQLVTRELHRLAHIAVGPAWGEREIRSRMHALIKRARLAAAGTKLEYDGEPVDPRYRWRNQTIIDLLEITPEEEREMRTIISATERRRRDRERKDPKMTREAYEGRAQDRRAEAARLIGEGLGAAQIASRLGVSRQHVYKLLKAAPEV